MLSWPTQVWYTRQALQYLNNEPAVERYAWFTSRGYGVSGHCQELQPASDAPSALSVLGCRLLCPDLDFGRGMLSRNVVLLATGQ